MPIRYKTFTFPHNPEKLQINCTGRFARQMLPLLGEKVQELGPRCRTITGEGCLFGPMALEHAQMLEALHQQGGAGSLTLPGCAPIRAFFTELTILWEGDGSAYPYRFTFLEEQAGGGGTL